MKNFWKRVISLFLALMLAFGTMPATIFAYELQESGKKIQSSVSEKDGTEEADYGEEAEIVPLYKEILVEENKLQINGTVLEDKVYGHVKNYELKKGHTLSIGSDEHVFSVRLLVDGNYSTMLKQATAEGYTAESDITVGAWIRRPDSSELAEGELAGIRMIDSQYGMAGVPGYAHRFTVEAETIEGGTATTRAAIFLPESYSEHSEATPLVIMTNGARGHISDSIWNNGTTDDIALMKNYMEANYAILVVDNTAGAVGGAQDWGNPQHVDSYFKAYEYVQKYFNIEEQFYLHSRSMGTMAATRIMRERPELVKCAIMCGAVSSLEAYFKNDPSFIAKRFGFDDLSGATYEADKVRGYDTYADIADAIEYNLPPTFWMLSEADATSRTLTMIEDIEAYGNDVKQKVYTETDHSGVCRLNIEECWNDAMAYFAEYEESEPISFGDINLDGSVNVMDAYYARLVAAKLIKPTAEQLSAGDVDSDGKITAIDANIIRKYAVRIIAELPV